jgi:hypothetical protein
LVSGGVGLRSLTEAMDSTTPGGRLIFHLFGALAQFEPNGGLCFPLFVAARRGGASRMGPNV